MHTRSINGVGKSSKLGPTHCKIITEKVQPFSILKFSPNCKSRVLFPETSTSSGAILENTLNTLAPHKILPVPRFSVPVLFLFICESRSTMSNKIPTAHINAKIRKTSRNSRLIDMHCLVHNGKPRIFASPLQYKLTTFIYTGSHIFRVFRQSNEN